MERDFEVLKRFVVKDPDYLWDEWGLYAHYNDFVGLIGGRKSECSSVVEGYGNGAELGYDIICSVGKSGLIFASYLAIKYKKPLIVYSVGEFIDQGAYVIGYGEYEKEMIKGKRILMIDSHVRTGNTIGVINGLFLDKVSMGWLVLLDCREDYDKMRSGGVNIKSIFAFDDKFREKLEADGVERSKLYDADFWMKKEMYWLGRNGLMISSESDGGFVAEKSNEICILPMNKHLYRDTKSFCPLKVYTDVNEFEDVANAFLNNIIGCCNEKKVLLITMTLGAVPLGVACANKFYENEKKDVGILFPLYRSEKYYKDLIDEYADGTIILMDDVITTGGMLYEFYKRYLKGQVRRVVLASMLKVFMQKEEEEEKKFSSYFYRLVSDIIRCDGCVVVGGIVD
jgi:orotate phosphoribosyltransferase